MLSPRSANSCRFRLIPNGLLFAGKITDDSIFEPYYAEVEQMILDEMQAHGIEYHYENEDEEESGHSWTRRGVPRRIRLTSRR